MPANQNSIQNININDRQWINIISNHPNATIFHHPAWLKVLADCYGYRPFLIVLRDEDGEISAGLPFMEINSWLTGKRWVALPFSDHCCPLFQNKNDLELFCNELIGKNKRIKSPRVEIRQELPLLDGIVHKNSYFIHYLNLDKKPDEIFKKFRKKGVQYCIKKAAKYKIEISQSTELESVMTFYNLHLMTRKKHGVPIQPKKYFLKLWENIIKKEFGFVALAYYNNNAIAGGVFLHYNEKMYYKYGATDPEYMRFYATHALLWEAIKWGCNNGYKVMDWGKTEKNNHGLKNFKLGWGTEEKELIYSYIGKPPKEYSAGWKQKIIGNIIRKSPVLVGRTIGEILYKHVG